MRLKVNVPNPTFEKALLVAKGLNDSPGSNDEYERAILEFIIDLFAIEDGMDARSDLALTLGWNFP